VDTHVARVARRLGLTASDDPLTVEADLMARLPRTQWLSFAHQIIAHGRALCKAQRPLCPACPLNDLCPASTVAAAAAS
jgi:endonuclease III